MADKDRLEEKFFSLLSNPGALAGVVICLVLLVGLFVFLAIALLKKIKLRPISREIVITTEEGKGGKSVGGKGDKKKLMDEDDEEEGEGVGRGPIWLGRQQTPAWLKGQQFVTVSLTDDPKNAKI